VTKIWISYSKAFNNSSKWIRYQFKMLAAVLRARAISVTKTLPKSIHKFKTFT
jgi:hypothetical protein